MKKNKDLKSYFTSSKVKTCETTVLIAPENNVIGIFEDKNLATSLENEKIALIAPENNGIGSVEDRNLNNSSSSNSSIKVNDDDSKKKWNQLFSSNKTQKKQVQEIKFDDIVQEDPIANKFRESLHKSKFAFAQINNTGDPSNATAATSYSSVNNLDQPVNSFFMKKEKTIKTGTASFVEEAKQDISSVLLFPKFQHVGQDISLCQNLQRFDNRKIRSIHSIDGPFPDFKYLSSNENLSCDLSLSIFLDFDSKHFMNLKLTSDSDIILINDKQLSSFHGRALCIEYAISKLSTYKNEVAIDLAIPKEDLVSDNPPSINKSSLMLPSRREISDWLKSWNINLNSSSKLSGHKSNKSSARGKRSYNDYSDDSDEDQEEFSTILALVGSHACGKSSLIHSYCRDSGINLIEINPGQLRSGAAIKKLVSEATQSYGLSKNNSLQRENGYLNGISIILFDEVDICFEEDTAFYSSIHQIAKSSRCPIVLTSEDIITFLNTQNIRSHFMNRPSIATALDALQSEIHHLNSPKAFRPLDANIGDAKNADNCDSNVTCDNSASTTVERVLLSSFAFFSGNDVRASRQSLGLATDYGRRGINLSASLDDSFSEFLNSKGLDITFFDSIEFQINRLLKQSGNSTINQFVGGQNDAQAKTPLSNKIRYSFPRISISKVFPKIITKFSNDYFSEGNLFALYGKGFALNTVIFYEVFLGGFKCEIYFASDNQIYVRIPPGISKFGVYNITIKIRNTNHDSSSSFYSSSDSFTPDCDSWIFISFPDDISSLMQAQVKKLNNNPKKRLKPSKNVIIDPEDDSDFEEDDTQKKKALNCDSNNGISLIEENSDSNSDDIIMNGENMPIVSKKRVLIDDDEDEENDDDDFIDEKKEKQKEKEKKGKYNDKVSIPTISEINTLPESQYAKINHSDYINFLLSFIAYFSSYECSNILFNVMSLIKKFKYLNFEKVKIDLICIRQSITEGLYGKSFLDNSFSDFLNDIRSLFLTFKEAFIDGTSDILYEIIFLSNIFEIEVDKIIRNSKFIELTNFESKLDRSLVYSCERKSFSIEDVKSSENDQVDKESSFEVDKSDIQILESMAIFYSDLSDSDLFITSCYFLSNFNEDIEIMRLFNSSANEPNTDTSEQENNANSSLFNPPFSSLDSIQDTGLISNSNAVTRISTLSYEAENLYLSNILVQIDASLRKLARSELFRKIKNDMDLNEQIKYISYERCSSPFLNRIHKVKVKSLKAFENLSLYEKYLTESNTFYFFNSKLRSSILVNLIGGLFIEDGEIFKLSKRSNIISQKARLFTLSDSMSLDFYPYTLRIISEEKANALKFSDSSILNSNRGATSGRRETRSSFNSVAAVCFPYLLKLFPFLNEKHLQFISESYSYSYSTCSNHIFDNGESS